MVFQATSFNVKSLSATGLALLQSLLKENHQKAISIVVPLMWQIALNNRDTNVAMAAMQIISNHYVYSRFFCLEFCPVFLFVL